MFANWVNLVLEHSLLSFNLIIRFSDTVKARMEKYLEKQPFREKGNRREGKSTIDKSPGSVMEKGESSSARLRLVISTRQDPSSYYGLMTPPLTKSINEEGVSTALRLVNVSTFVYLLLPPLFPILSPLWQLPLSLSFSLSFLLILLLASLFLFLSLLIRHDRPQ